jgi:hypothetical protein
MTQISTSAAGVKAGGGPRAFGGGYILGIPIGDLGWFTSLLMGVASGFVAFFASTFCAIITLLIWNSTTHANVDYALSYRRVGLPVGLFVLIVALSTLGTFWLRRILRKA